MRAERRAAARLLAWFLIFGALTFTGAQHLEISYDLGLFLPAPQTPAQRILVERFGESPGSNYVLIALPDEPARIAGLAATLQDTPGIERVLSDLLPPPDTPPEPVWTYRYLLADTDWSVSGLSDLLGERLSELGMGTAPVYEELIARDPGLLSVALLEALTPGTDGPWRIGDGRRVLVAETSEPAFRLDAQRRVLEEVERAVEANFTDTDQVLMSGAGVLGVGLRETIQLEAAKRSIWAGALIAALLLLAYRRFSVLWLAALPLATGFVTGVAVVAIAYGQVHGITLAFGFTLLGVTIDYPLHLLSRTRRESSTKAIRTIWPTLRLSALSTVLAYAALMAGGVQSMAQLGLFSATGIIGAVATTRWVLPWLVRGSGETVPVKKDPIPRLRFTAVSAAAAIGAGLAVLAGDRPWWAADLAALSPIPAERLTLEGRLRQATGAPNIRYLVALEDPDLQTVLARGEVLHDVLENAVQQGLIKGFHDLTPLLPSATTQLDRRDAIPGRATLEAIIRTATAHLPFSPSAFDGFVEEADASRGLPPLLPQDYTGSPLQGALGRHLYLSPTGRWTALATLRGNPDAAKLRTLLANRLPTAIWVDLRSASGSLVSAYRQHILAVLGAVVALIALLLIWRLRPERAAWTLSLVLANVFLAASFLRWLMGPLDLYHLAGLLLVAGIGLDYALFLGKADERASRHAVFACMASTVGAFGVLSGSSIPTLSSLGSAVALGSLLCFVTAWAGSRGGSSRQ